MVQTVTFAVDAKNTQAIAAFMAVSKAIEGVNVEFDKGGKAGKRSGDDATAAWSAGLNILKGYPLAMTKMVTGTAGVYLAVKQLVAEYERLKEVRSSADDSLRATRPEFMRMQYSMPEDLRSSPELDKARGNWVQAAGGNPADTYGLAAHMASAGGGNVPKQVLLDAIGAMALIKGQQAIPAEDSQEIGGGVMDIMKTYLDKGGKADAREIIGGFMSGNAESRTTTQQQMAMHELVGVNYLMRNQHASYAEAVGFFSAYGGNIPDPTGRKSRTGGIHMFEDLDKAFAELQAKGLQEPKFKDINEWNKQSIWDKIAAAKGDDEFGDLMQSFLFGQRHPKQQVRDLSYIWGEAHMGSIRGEAGTEATTEEMLSQDKHELVDRAKAASKRVKVGQAARDRFDEAVKGQLKTPTEQYFADVQAQEGLDARMQVENVQRAQQGLLQKLVEKTGMQLGKTDIGQKFLNIANVIESSNQSPDQLRDMLLKYGTEFQNLILDSHEWSREENFKFNDQMMLKHGVAGYFMDPMGEIREEKRDRTRAMMTEDEAKQFEALNQFKRGILSNIERQQPPQPPKAEPTEEAGEPAAVRMPFRHGRRMGRRGVGSNPPSSAPKLPAMVPADDAGEATPQNAEPLRAPAAGPAPGDQSSFRGVLERLDQLADAISKLADSERVRQVDVTVRDETGRQIGRSTSRPRSLELLSDNALG